MSNDGWRLAGRAMTVAVVLGFSAGCDEDPESGDAGRSGSDAGAGDAGSGAFDAGVDGGAEPSDAGSDGGADADGGTCSDACPFGCDGAGCDEPAEIALGYLHACLRTGAGRIYCWGDGELGRLGSGPLPGGAGSSNRPLAVPSSESDPSPLRASSLLAAGNVTCAHRASDEQLVCWGFNLFGQVKPSLSDREVPFPVEADYAGAPLVELATSRQRACGRTAAGEVTCWGNGGAPAAVAAPAGTTFADLTAAEDTTFYAVLSDTEVSAWGEGATEAARFAFEGDATFDGVRFAASGQSETWAWVESGARATRLARWPTGPSTPTISLPTDASFRVAGVSDLVGSGSGDAHFCARVGTAARCWGSNEHGQTGQVASTEPVEAPSAVMLLPAAQQIAVGRGFSCALTVDGVFCWGTNESGQLGVGADTPPSAARPQAIVGPDL